MAKKSIMAGTVRDLQRKDLTDEDRAVWDEDFDLLVTDLSKLVDPELGEDLKGEKEFYTYACEVAKGYFNEKPFGGLKSASGQYGFRMIAAQDLKAASGDASVPAQYSWLRRLTTESAKTEVLYVFGSGSATAYTSSEANKFEVLAFHRLISFRPSPRVILVEFTVNGYPYVPYAIEPFSKIRKDSKLYTIIPMPGAVILHPGGRMGIDMFFDLETGQTAPTGTSNIDIEIGLFGLVFGEYDYLAAAELT